MNIFRGHVNWYTARILIFMDELLHDQSAFRLLKNLLHDIKIYPIKSTTQNKTTESFLS